MVTTSNAMENNVVRLEPEVPPLDWLEHYQLDVVRGLYLGVLPEVLVPTENAMDDLWNLHPPSAAPASNVRVSMAPCWQQAYGKSYRASRALPIPQALAPLLSWSRETIDPRINGACLNWYDARFGHHMGMHRDNTKGLVKGSPIVTVSLGAPRVFRLRPWWPRDVREFLTGHGTVCVMPFETNRVWRHGVLHHAWDCGRRISVTFRAFEEPALPLHTEVANLRSGATPREAMLAIRAPEPTSIAAHEGGW